MVCRSWYMIYFQAPWLPEFMLGGADFAFLDGAFKSGPVAPRSKGAISDDDIERCGAPGPQMWLWLADISRLTCIHPGLESAGCLEVREGQMMCVWRSSRGSRFLAVLTALHCDKQVQAGLCAAWRKDGEPQLLPLIL